MQDGADEAAQKAGRRHLNNGVNGHIRVPAASSSGPTPITQLPELAALSDRQLFALLPRAARCCGACTGTRSLVG